MDFLQFLTNGYDYVDALVENCEQLQSDDCIDYHEIYRNVICRPLSGINSTGLREDIYDVVVMAGCEGFGEHPATVLGELLRITKPGRYTRYT